MNDGTVNLVELLEALDICANRNLCIGCPYEKKKPGCSDKLMRDAQEAIQRLDKALAIARGDRLHE